MSPIPIALVEMAGRGILDADMATVGRWIVDGFRWWVEELRALVPSSLQGRAARSRRPALIVGLDGVVRDAKSGDSIAQADDKPQRAVDVLLPQERALVRRLPVPKMRTDELNGYVALEADRLLPLPVDQLLMVAGKDTRADSADDNMPVHIVAARRTDARDALNAVRALGYSPVRLGLGDAARPDRIVHDLSFDFRGEGELPAETQAFRIWWALVGFLFLLNIGVMIWRDQHSVDTLRDAVAAQEPAVAVYRAMARRSASTVHLAAQTAEARARRKPMEDLAAVTAALPDAAWVQRYQWDGRSLRLSGYQTAELDLVSALEAHPRFSQVQPAGAEIDADIPIGEPFDIVMDLEGRAR